MGHSEHPRCSHSMSKFRVLDAPSDPENGQSRGNPSTGRGCASGKREGLQRTSGGPNRATEGPDGTAAGPGPAYGALGVDEDRTHAWISKEDVRVRLPDKSAQGHDGGYKAVPSLGPLGWSS